MKTLFKAAMLCLITGSLTACLNTPEKNVVPTQISAEPTIYIVPISGNVIPSDSLLGYVTLTEFSRGGVDDRETLRFRHISNDTMVAYRRIGNKYAGSGINYKIKTEFTKGKETYTYKLTPYEYTTYQQGLIGRFDVPLFNEQQLTESLRKGTLNFTFEFDSQYKPNSVKANFDRKTNPVRDPNAGRVHSYTNTVIPYIYNLSYKGSTVKVDVNFEPYRDGTKVKVVAVIPASETSKNTIDYTILEKEVKAKLKAIVNS
jgi:hypothetical protein